MRLNENKAEQRQAKPLFSLHWNEFQIVKNPISVAKHWGTIWSLHKSGRQVQILFVL